MLTHIYRVEGNNMLVQVNAQRSLFEDIPAETAGKIACMWHIGRRLWRQKREMTYMRRCLVRRLDFDQACIDPNVRTIKWHTLQRQSRSLIDHHKTQQQMDHEYAFMCATYALLRYKAGPWVCGVVDGVVFCLAKVKSLKS